MEEKSKAGRPATGKTTTRVALYLPHEVARLGAKEIKAIVIGNKEHLKAFEMPSNLPDDPQHLKALQMLRNELDSMTKERDDLRRSLSAALEVKSETAVYEGVDELDKSVSDLALRKLAAAKKKGPAAITAFINRLTGMPS